MAGPETDSEAPLSIAEFNKIIFAYEDERVKELTHLITVIDSLQQSIPAPRSASLLKDSLRYLMEAQDQQELNVFRASFFAALEQTRLKTVLDVDSCINGLRDCADDLFYWTDLDSDPKIKKLASATIIADSLQTAQTGVDLFNQQAHTLEAEFKAQITKNQEEMQAILKLMEEKTGQLNEAYADQLERIEALKQDNLKYLAGIKRITTQKLQVKQALDIIKEIPATKTPEERQHKRADYAMALHSLRLIDKRTGFNHFVKKCETCVEQICAARTAYLAPEYSFANPLSTIAKLAVGRAVPFVSMLPLMDTLPAEFPGFTYGVANTTYDAAKDSGVLGKRQPTPLAKPTAWDYAKKTFSVLLGVSSLVLSGLMCLTIIGIPKGVALAATGVGMINTVKGGSDFFTEHSRQIKRNRAVTQQLESTESQIEALQKEANQHKKDLKTSSKKSSKKQYSSETKIDLLLLGQRPRDILSIEEIEGQNQTLPITPSVSTEPKAENVKATPKFMQPAPTQPSEDESETPTDDKPHLPGRS